MACRVDYVHRPNDIDKSDNDPSISRAKLSCGHVTSAKTLVESCTVQLKNGQVELKCPICMKVWPYGEVRTLLTHKEQLYFKDTLRENAAKKKIDIKGCPECGSFVERKHSSNLCVQCVFCTVKTGKTHEFCWQCGRNWKGPRPRTDKCDNLGCSDSDLNMLRDCKMITLTFCEDKPVQCPSIRACPDCGMLIEHTGVGCKSMACCNCTRSFCFVCLKSPNGCCTAGAAPRQTSIP
ncbi:E3 ubiquitin-protein ligase RNF19A-like [Siphateles boraxobius]|uniref:E3 ubiquitin-protein ligase RNF19A-like n=1 Tax=Siphateles boraxobius TaxID=180520 RepID=UPI00406362C6